MVRASLGAYNVSAKIDALVEMLERISLGEYHGDYYQVDNGDYRTVRPDEQVASSYAALVLSTLPERQFGSSAQ